MIILDSILGDQAYIGITFLVCVYFAWYIIRYTNVLWIFIELLIGTKVEKKMLDMLYKEFWYNRRKKIDNKWEDEVIKQQIDYLLINYCKYAQRIKLVNKVNSIEFNTNLRFKKNKRNFRLRIRSSLIISAFVVFISLLSSSPILVDNRYLVKDYMTMCLTVGFCTLLAGIHLKGLSTIFIGVLYDRKGYLIISKRKFVPKKRYVCECAIYEKNMYFDYVKVTKSILAFASLAINEKEWGAFKTIVEICKTRAKANEAVYILLIILLYLFTTKEKGVEKKIKKYLQDIKIEKTYIFKYGGFAKAFISDIENNIDNGTINSTSFDEYISEIK